jgi:3-oxoacyl-[acyl-carrier-protein] synthase-3
MRLILLITTSCALLQGINAFSPIPSQASLAKPSSSSTTTSQLRAAMGCRPIGTGSATPPTIITNYDLEKLVETSHDWIVTRTGISERHVLTGDETLRALSTKAGQQALDMAGLTASDIDIVICASSSPDDLFGDATSIASALGCSTQTVAFDLVAACSGFLFALLTAGKFLTGTNKKALVIGADALSRWVDWNDRNVCILFGDGAAAMVVEGSETSGVLGYAMHSNGGGWGDLNTA